MVGIEKDNIYIDSIRNEMQRYIAGLYIYIHVDVSIDSTQQHNNGRTITRTLTTKRIATKQVKMIFLRNKAIKLMSFVRISYTYLTHLGKKTDVWR